jgi:hypothetical protein
MLPLTLLDWVYRWDTRRATQVAPPSSLSSLPFVGLRVCHTAIPRHLCVPSSHCGETSGMALKQLDKQYILQFFFASLYSTVSSYKLFYFTILVGWERYPDEFPEVRFVCEILQLLKLKANVAPIRTKSACTYQNKKCVQLEMDRVGMPVETIDWEWHSELWMKPCCCTKTKRMMTMMTYRHLACLHACGCES